MSNVMASVSPDVLAGMLPFSNPFWPTDFTGAVKAEYNVLGWLYFKGKVGLFEQERFEKLTEINCVYPGVIQTRSYSLPNLSQTVSRHFTGELEARIRQAISVNLSGSNAFELTVEVDEPVITELKDRAQFYNAVVNQEKTENKLLQYLQAIVLRQYKGKTKGLIYVDRCLRVNSLKVQVVKNSSGSLDLDAGKLGKALQLPTLKLDAKNDSALTLSAEQPLFLAYDFDQVGNLLSTTSMNNALLDSTVVKQVEGRVLNPA